MADLWAYCGDCARWYYCSPTTSASEATVEPCPVCLSTPVAVRPEDEPEPMAS